MNEDKTEPDRVNTIGSGSQIPSAVSSSTHFQTLFTVLLEDEALPRTERADYCSSLKPDRQFHFHSGNIQDQLDKALAAVTTAQASRRLLIVSVHGEPFGNGSISVGPADRRVELNWRQHAQPPAEFPPNLIILFNCCAAGFPAIQSWLGKSGRRPTMLVGPVVPTHIRTFNEKLQEPILGILGDAAIADYRTELIKFITAFNKRFFPKYLDVPVRYIDERGRAEPQFSITSRLAAEKHQLEKGKTFLRLGYGKLRPQFTYDGPFGEPPIKAIKPEDITACCGAHSPLQARDASSDDKSVSCDAWARFVLLQHDVKLYWARLRDYHLAGEDFREYYVVAERNGNMPGIMVPHRDFVRAVRRVDAGDGPVTIGRKGMTDIVNDAQCGLGLGDLSAAVPAVLPCTDSADGQSPPMRNLEDMLRDEGFGWAIESLGDPDVAMTHFDSLLADARKEVPQSSLGIRSWPDLTLCSLEQLSQRDPDLFHGFLQGLVEGLSDSMLALSWILIHGAGIASMSLTYKANDMCEFTVRACLSNFADEEVTFQSKRIEDTALLQHLGILHMGEGSQFDGYFPLRVM